MKIGLVGIGTVGGAIYKDFLEKQIYVKAYDKIKNIGTFDDILDTDILFLCLPTLFIDNSYDKTSIYETCSKLSENTYQGLVVIKSTVEPTTCQKLSETYKLDIVHNPEFLSAKTAYWDFHNQKHIIVGKTLNISESKVKKLIEFYQRYYPSAEISICTSTESELVKIFCNSFYAVKIQFFNELYFVCKKLGMNFDNVRDMMLKNGWINPMHTMVPGTDGKLSFGGMCLPKDINALCSYMKMLSIPNYVLKGTIKEHNLIRPDN
jgi:UDPglucose 6-dehydrogenase